MTGITLGTRIYYTGDMANSPNVGTVAHIVRSAQWGESYDLMMDDGTTWNVTPGQIGPYAGHCNPRFSLLADVERFRADRLAQLVKS